MHIPKCLRITKLHKIAFFGFVSLTAFLMAANSLRASSYQEQKGTYKAEAYTLTVSWADIYNMRPKPLHARRTVVELTPHSGWALYSESCTATIADQTKSLASNGAHFTPKHFGEVHIRCTLKSTENKSITSVDARYRISIAALSSPADLKSKPSLKLEPIK